MKYCNGIDERLSTIFKKRAGIDFIDRKNLRTEKILGVHVRMPSRELVFALYDIQAEFGIKIQEKYIKDGLVDTYENILNLIEDSVVNSE
ncbi:MAG: hypothetical protein LBL49_07585 [Clostridiales Family XIII bacterium]|jgi:peptide maturation system acyl carrier-related protein|nr:hypothetical protein [Clostridiales Family XIII bacterium]